MMGLSTFEEPVDLIALANDEDTSNVKIFDFDDMLVRTHKSQ